MKNNTVKIYIASSNEEVVGDKIELSNLVRRLNDIYESNGVEIKLLEADSLVSEEEKYKDINAKISESDLFVSLMYEHVDNLTVKEVDVAVSEFNDDSQSKIYPYIKQSDVDSEELAKFKNYLLNELSLNWSNYTNNDTMKLHFVMQIHSIESSIPVKLEVHNSIVKLGEENIADLNNVPFAANNESFISFKEQFVNLNKEIQGLDEVLASNEDGALREIYWDKCKARTEVRENLENLEKSLFETALLITNLHCITSSDRLRRAIAKFEKGDNKGAIAVLDSEQIDADIKLAINTINQGSENIAKIQDVVRINIKEYLLKASTTLTDFDNENRFADACSYYEMAIDAAKKCELPQEEIFESEMDYAHFLASNKKNSKSSEIFNRVLKFLSNKANPDVEVLMRILYSKSNIGVNLFVSRNQDDAEIITLEALDLCNKLRDENLKLEEKLWEYYSDIHNTLGLVYVDKYDYEKAEFHHKEALSYRRKIAEKDTSYLHMVSQSLDNLGLLYYEFDEFDKAEKMYLEAVEVYEELSKITGKQYSSIIINQDSLGALYVKTEEYDKALEAYTKALNYAESIYLEFPEKYKPELARVHDSLGKLMMILGEVELAKKHLVISINHYMQLCEEEIDAYIGSVESILNFLNENLVKYNKASETESLTIKLLGIYSRIDKLKKHQGAIFSCLATAYLAQNNFDEAEKLLLTLIKASEDVSEPPRLADLINMGTVYVNKENFAEAEKYYHAALQRINDEGSEKFDDYKIASLKFNVGYSHLKTNKLDSAIAYLSESEEMARQLKKNEPLDYNEFHARNLMYLGVANLWCEKGDEAIGFMSEALCSYLYISESRCFAHKNFIFYIIKNINSMLPNSADTKEFDDYVAKEEDVYLELKNADGKGTDLRVPMYFSMAARCLLRTCVYYSRINNFKKLEVISSKAQNIYRILYLIDDTKYLSDLAAVIEFGCIAYNNSGKYNMTEKLFKQEIDIFLNRDDVGSEEIMSHLLQARNDLACCYDNQEKFKEAIEVMQDNLDIYLALAEDEPDKYKADLARTESNLAYFYGKDNKFKKSEELNLRSIKKYEELIELDSREYYEYDELLARNYYNIANLYTETNDYKSAEKYYLSAIKVREKMAEKPTFANLTCLADYEYGLGAYFQDLGRDKESLTYYKSSLKHYLKTNNHIVHKEKIDDLTYLVNSLSLQVHNQDKAAKNKQSLSMDELDSKIENEEYAEIVNKMSNVKDLNAEESFCVALSFLRLEMPQKAVVIFEKLYSDESNGEGIRFTSMTNVLVSLLMLKQFEKYQEIYQNLSDEDKQDDDVKIIHACFENRIVVKPKRSLKDRLFNTNNEVSYTIEIPKPYGYMF